jgi:3-oxoacyl-[acyl-carrier-protein] synthase II
VYASTPRRVVVTGVGLISAVGNTAEETWAALLAGKSGVNTIQSFDTAGFSCTIAAEVKGFDPLNFIDKKEAKKMARFIHFALAASEEALKQSGLEITPQNAEKVGVHIGSGIGGFDIIEREHTNLMQGGPRKISPFFIPAAIINLAAGQVSMRFGAKGPNEATATACTTSCHSIGDAAKVIQRGDADVMIAGGSEAAVTPMGIGGFAAMRALSTRNDDPATASRPWDKDRDGFVVGEGSGILILEELEHAKARGAKILAELVGYGMSGDAFHITQPAPEHEGAFRCMMNAIHDAGIQKEQIGYVNAHGTSTPIGDALESQAIKNLFGDHVGRVAEPVAEPPSARSVAGKNGVDNEKLVVSSTKSMTGHLLGGAGGLEAGITVLALRDQRIPPTANIFHQDPECDLDYCANNGRPKHLEYALSNSFGFGGTNGSLLFKRWAE